MTPERIEGNRPPAAGAKRPPGRSVLTARLGVISFPSLAMPRSLAAPPASAESCALELGHRRRVEPIEHGPACDQRRQVLVDVTNQPVNAWREHREP